MTEIQTLDDRKLLREAMLSMTPKGILEEIEVELQEALEDPKTSDRRMDGLKEALFRLGLVRRNLANNSSRDLLFNFYCLMNLLLRAKIRQFEGSIFHKAHLQRYNKYGTLNSLNKISIDYFTTVFISNPLVGEVQVSPTYAPLRYREEPIKNCLILYMSDRRGNWPIIPFRIFQHKQ